MELGRSDGRVHSHRVEGEDRRQRTVVAESNVTVRDACDEGQRFDSYNDSNNSVHYVKLQLIIAF